MRKKKKKARKRFHARRLKKRGRRARKARRHKARKAGRRNKARHHGARKARISKAISKAKRRMKKRRMIRRIRRMKKHARQKRQPKKKVARSPARYYQAKRSVKRTDKAILIILDGWGIKKGSKSNAVEESNAPNMRGLAKKYPTAVIDASAAAVGLPKGQMGNSEVGHMNIGAGRIVGQEFMIISKAIRNRSFFKNKALVDAIKNANNIHLMGLVSDGGVHSHIEHLFALIKMASKYRKHVNVHAFLDGRDTPKKSAERYLAQTEKALKGIGEIATISGRYYAMDRDKRWDRTEKTYNCLNKSYCIYSSDPISALNDAYKRGESDEFVSPAVTSPHYKGIEDGDTVIFFNFREDRARQLTRAFVDDYFMDFKRAKKNVKFVCMTRYDQSIEHVSVAFEQEKPANTIGEVISKAGLKQLRAAETEKYAHVTFFFNGTREDPFKGEDRVLIPSPHITTYDLKPEMSAYEVKDAVVSAIKQDKHSFIAVNFANCDMVGHTGIMEAAVKAVEAVDRCVGEIVIAGLHRGWNILITADHGNCEEMSGDHQTTHTTNPVPLILVSNREYRLKKRGRLCNIAPTILQIMGLKRPKEMESGMIVK